MKNDEVKENENTENTQETDKSIVEETASTENVEKVEIVENTETTENAVSNSTQNQNTNIEEKQNNENENSSNKNTDTTTEHVEENNELERLRVENTKLKVANKYKLTEEQLDILGEVDEGFEKRAKALSTVILDRAKNSANALQRDPNIGQRNTHNKVLTGNDWLRGVLDGTIN